MRRFDETGLLDQLDRLSPPCRVAFAASCATRMLPAYEYFCKASNTGDLERLRRAVDSVWGALLEKLREKPFYEAELAAVMELVPPADFTWTLGLPPAEDAVVTVVFALRTILTRQSQEAVFAARRVYDSLDYLVKYWKNPDAPSIDPDILGDPVIQAEFSRQDRDIADLFNPTGLDNFTLFSRIRGRAAVEPAVTPNLVDQ